MNRAEFKMRIATTWESIKKITLAGWTGVHLSAAAIWSGAKIVAVFIGRGLKSAALAIGRWLRKALPVIWHNSIWVMRAIGLWIRRTAPVVWGFIKRVVCAIGRLVRRIAIAIYRRIRRAYAENPNLRVYTIIVVIVLVLAGVAIGFGQWQKNVPGQTTSVTTSPAAAERGNTVVVGTTGMIDIVNPLFSIGDGENDAVSLIFEPLVQLNETGEATGQLAASWSFDASAHQLTFQMVTDHTFRDGRIVNAADVVFTYQCLLSKSYDGPLQGRFGSILTVAQGSTPDQVVFTLADWVQTPDFALYTIGILKADYYIVNLERVFEMSTLKQAPEGSGSFYQAETQEDRLILNLREGYGGSIKSITIRKIASEDKYSMLQRGEIDITSNIWDTRMAERAKTLSGYQLTHFSSSVEEYFLVNPSPDVDSVIQLPEQRLAVLLTAAGRTLNVLQQQALVQLADKTLTLYFYAGLDASSTLVNQVTANSLADKLKAAGLDVKVSGTSWPQLAAMATSGSYDILLLPTTDNNRLPDGTQLLMDPAQSNDSAFIAKNKNEVYIVSSRLTQVTINRNGHPFAALAGSWTDRVENIRILNSDGSYWEEKSP